MHGWARKEELEQVMGNMLRRRDEYGIPVNLSEIWSSYAFTKVSRSLSQKNKITGWLENASFSILGDVRQLVAALLGSVNFDAYEDAFEGDLDYELVGNNFWNDVDLLEGKLDLNATDLGRTIRKYMDEGLLYGKMTQATRMTIYDRIQI